ncbi:MAG: hypothetical protein ALAOOOJD_00584 [bacterium]|nr:hypothetical protein [bacterium]
MLYQFTAFGIFTLLCFSCSEYQEPINKTESPKVQKQFSVLPDSAEELSKFLKTHLPIVYKVETGTEVFFKDAFLPIPDSLQVKLEKLFPDFEFKIAKMAFLHWGPEDANLLVVLERDFLNQKSFQVHSFVWAIWFDGKLTFSFRSLLFHHSLVSLNNEIDYYEHVDVLAKLLALTSNRKFIKTYKTADGDIVAEMESERYFLSLLTFRKRKSRMDYGGLALETIDKRNLKVQKQR